MMGKVKELTQKDMDTATNTLMVQKKKERNLGCAAFGCPMPGTRSNSISGSDEWWCRYHFNQDGAQNDLITHRIKQNRSLFLQLKDARESNDLDKKSEVLSDLKLEIMEGVG